MKFCIALSALSLLAPGVLAGPAKVERDIATIQGVLSDINSQVNALQTAIQATPLDPEAIVAQSDTLVQTIKDGAVTVNAQPVLTQLEALGLVAPTQQLADDTDATVQTLIGVKEDIVELGEGCTTLEALQAQYEAAQELAAAIVSKVPDALGDIANELAQSISTAIQNGIDAYQGTCDGGEPTSTTEPPTSTPSPTRTACPAPKK
ncbi:cell wall mannoprotein 1 family protein [Aspergillus lucknowensis]|uniref:Hydrophobic surface binding protein A-domain-containing protein n=1 Tax=Aspergillus lucknowensis TaxID=176173 RepID=A0ABR4LT76_9EURO